MPVRMPRPNSRRTPRIRGASILWRSSSFIIELNPLFFYLLQNPGVNAATFTTGAAAVSGSAGTMKPS
ncbi:hypothetical protein LTSEURB_2927, partial [Salmonella enterica subsp. enterica serovar Urbana str. R8-2977]